MSILSETIYVHVIAITGSIIVHLFFSREISYPTLYISWLSHVSIIVVIFNTSILKLKKY